MTRYIGLDVHCASTTAVAVNGRGKRICRQVLETSGQALIQFVKSQPGPVEVCLEEGVQSGWLAEVLSPHVAKVVVTHVGKGRDKKNDAEDAMDLAQRLAAGRINQPVYKGSGPFAALQQLVKAHRSIVGDTVRTQSRIKALYRSRGVTVVGKDVYLPAQRQYWLNALPVSFRLAASLMYASYDGLQATRKEAHKAVVTELERHPISSLLRSCPGMGPLRVAQLLAVVVTPHRFRKRQQFWAYCGLGIVMRSSSDWVQQENGSWMRSPVCQTRGLNRKHNRALKHVFKGAATTAIDRRSDNPFRTAYLRLLEAGTKPNLAKLTIARKIAATVLAMWKRNEAYELK